jgi:hypothetical protein
VTSCVKLTQEETVLIVSPFSGRDDEEVPG